VRHDDFLIEAIKHFDEVLFQLKFLITPEKRTMSLT
jgi:hypothetical protein